MPKVQIYAKHVLKFDEPFIIYPNKIIYILACIIGESSEVKRIRKKPTGFREKCNYLLHVYHYRGDRFGDDIKKMSLIIDIFRNEVNYTNA